MSFNNIEAIEGLDTLVNLEDLSLSNNRISKMDSLDNLVKLQVLSLGNNQISNMMNVSTRPGDPCHKYHGALGCAKTKVCGGRHTLYPIPRKIKHPNYPTRALNALKDHA